MNCQSNATASGPAPPPRLPPVDVRVSGCAQLVLALLWFWSGQLKLGSLNPMKTIDAIYGVPDDTPTVEVFVADSGPLVGEIAVTEGRLVFKLYCSGGSQPQVVAVDELEQVFALARERLL